MTIKLPRLPLKFSTPDGEMEVTVRQGLRGSGANDQALYCGAASFITHGPRALERIPLTPNMKSHGEVMHALLTGFKVKNHDESSLDYRVMKSLCATTGVEEIESN